MAAIASDPYVLYLVSKLLGNCDSQAIQMWYPQTEHDLHFLLDGQAGERQDLVGQLKGMQANVFSRNQIEAL